MYHHQLNRLQIINRSALIALLHHRTLHVQSEHHDNGGPITLMSVDVETLSTLGDMLHETWAYILEVIIGTTLLASQIKWLCLVPLVGVCCECQHVMLYLFLLLSGTDNTKVHPG